jgi:hypothetical protein
MNLHDELERSIGAGPPAPPPTARLSDAHAALRRRRLALATGAAVALAAVVLPVAVLTGGTPSSGREVRPAAPSPSASSRVELFEPGESAPLDVDPVTRRLVLEKGAVVNARVDGVARDIVGWSAALDITQGDRRYWVVLAWDETRVDMHYDEVEPGRSGLADWADFYVPRLEKRYAPGRAPSERVPGLSWEGDRFVATGDTQVLDQRSPVDLGERFAPDGATTGAALVDLGGLRLLVLYREVPGSRGQVIASEDVGDRDLGRALAWAREKYDSEVGLR